MKQNWKTLIDGDIIAYRAGFSSNDLTVEEALLKTDSLVSTALEDSEYFTEGNHQVFLTGKGNFRFDIAKTAIYKGNRKDSAKPIHLPAIREHMCNKYSAIVSSEEEADDLIAIEATSYGKNALVASIDKDMLQIPCYHYNLSKRLFSVVGEFQGLKFFYTQILTGDSADNIIGLYKCGPVKAKKLLLNCNTEIELWDACVDAYDGDKERVIENARLLWLRREVGQIWEPPSA